MHAIDNLRGSPGWQTQPLKKSHQSILLEIPPTLRVPADLEVHKKKAGFAGKQSYDHPDEQASTSLSRSVLLRFPQSQHPRASLALCDSPALEEIRTMQSRCIDVSCIYYTMFTPHYKMLDLCMAGTRPDKCLSHAFPVVGLTIIYTQKVYLEFRFGDSGVMNILVTFGLFSRFHRLPNRQS